MEIYLETKYTDVYVRKLTIYAIFHQDKLLITFNTTLLDDNQKTPLINRTSKRHTCPYKFCLKRGLQDVILSIEMHQNTFQD